MLNTLALNLIADVMGWGNDRATKEYGWLKLMSSIKYDGYSDFRAGVRFLESLVPWLRQFKTVPEREAAYFFVKRRLVYISSLEMQRVIESFVPEVVKPYLRKVVASRMGIKPYEVWGNAEASNEFSRQLRRCLFVGLSDGSRIDVLRRANAGRLSQEQVVPMMNIDQGKWEGLAKDLVGEQGNDAKFEDVFLIDDFTASGTTFIRFSGDAPSGKLGKFETMVQLAKKTVKPEAFPLAQGYNLHIHHYLSTAQARSALEERVREAQKKLPDPSFSSAVITEGLLLPEHLPLGVVDKSSGEIDSVLPADQDMVALCDDYYDHQLFIDQEKHCREAGQTSMKYGYAYCALPLVLEHNTPNNSVPLLWAETSGKQGHPMAALFNRRSRHG